MSELESVKLTSPPGVIVKLLCVVTPNVTAKIAVVVELTTEVLIVNVPLDAPAGMRVVFGTVAAALFEDMDMVAPPGPAGP